MNRLRKWEKITVVLLLIASLVCLGMGFESFYSARGYDIQAYEATKETLDKEEDFLHEVERQVAYQESHPEDTTLSHVDFLALVLKEQSSSLSQQKVLLYRSAASAEFAKGAFLLAIVGWLGAVTGWLYAFRNKIKKPEGGRKMGTKGRKNIKKPKMTKEQKEARRKKR